MTDESLALPAGARLVLAGTADWPTRNPAPAFDVGALPGARVVLDAARGDDARFVRVACVTAPTERWAPGLEDTVLGYATWLAFKSLGPEPLRLAGGTVDASSPAGGAASHFHQPLFSADPAWTVSGWHELGFVGAPSVGLLCSLACVERTPSEACARVASESRIAAEFRAEPPPSLVVRALLWAASEPLATGALSLALSFALVALWLRGRPRWSST